MPTAKDYLDALKKIGLKVELSTKHPPRYRISNKSRCYLDFYCHSDRLDDDIGKDILEYEIDRIQRVLKIDVDPLKQAFKI